MLLITLFAITVKIANFFSRVPHGLAFRLAAGTVIARHPGTIASLPGRLASQPSADEVPTN
jgi:hypothetical protein